MQECDIIAILFKALFKSGLWVKQVFIVLKIYNKNFLNSF